jgi:hypothetical protein
MKMPRALAGFAFVASLFAATSAQAVLSPGAFGPDSNPAVAVSPAFGPLAPGGALADNYIDFGVDFTWGGVEGFFDDGDVNEFGGINDAGILDLLTAVDGRIVALGTTNQATSNFIFAEAGFAAPGSLLLEAFDINGDLLASEFSTNALGPNNRSVWYIATPGIAFFRISGNDTFGVAQISIDPRSIGGGVPEPATWAMMILGFGLVGFAARRRVAATA